ncbi:MAG TPA: PD-(D/E)XK nuclease family protein [Candidatus Limnocylindria bacterium]|nr:PD-(D/E)XK nuclease family protein [Candidatus Limnocylindria bacterium]
MKVLWTSREWAEAIAALAVDPPLPSRTVLVPRERVSHSLRRELIRAGHAPVLAGTRFLSPAAAAIAVLEAAGADFTPGEDAVRTARLLALFRHGLRLEHFGHHLLATNPGWDDAFARTIGDLEAAGLRPSDLERPGATAGLRDVAAVWRATNESAGPSWTAARIFVDATAALNATPGLWPFAGRTLAAIGSGIWAAEAAFVRAIPRVELALLGTRPLRPRHVARVAALVGHDAAEALAAAAAPRPTGSERALLASYLFEPPAILADPARPRSSGPDGTVDLEEHAGVETEIEATADWVARQVMDGTPLEDIAVLMPAPDPLAALVAERLARLPWHDGALPVHVGGGLPLVGTAAGARALAVVHGLAGYLAGDLLAAVLPALKTTGPDARRLSHGEAMELVWSLGTAGGSAAHPAGALEWAARAAARERAIAVQLERAQAAGDDPEQAGLVRQARDLQRVLANLTAVRPALDALHGVAALVVGAAPLTAVWPALREFLERWLLQPGEGPRVHTLLDERLAAVSGDRACGALAGDDALGLIGDALGAMRVPVRRFGEPAVYVGTVEGAVGLRFAAVRIIGLAEGHLPPMPREDPVIPDAVRATLVGEGSTASPPTGADRALAALHAFDSVVRDATARVALSAPRLDLERSQREAASVMLEAAAALGRPNAATGEAAAIIPDGDALRRDAFAPARQSALAFRERRPLGEAAWQDAVAGGRVGTPLRWRDAAALDLERIAALQGAEAAAALDGILGAAVADFPVPGLTPDRPISASALKNLLQCPHLFLLGNLLGLEEPAGAPTLREIGQPDYGSLFHLLAQDFYRLHGTAFCARQGTIDDWIARSDGLVEAAFTGCLEQYPLVGGAVRDKQRERLRGDFHDLLRHDWTMAGPRFVAVERSFGRPVPVEIRLGARSLYVHGQIDRLDAAADHVLVRDLKTGRAYPRVGAAAEPDPVLDIQIAVYGLVAGRLAGEWGLPRRVAAAYTYVGRGADERSWRDDFDTVLEPAARRWLGIAADLLAERAFPRTSDPGDCTFCRFRPVCGSDVYERAGRLLAAGGGVLARLGALKSAGDEEDD